MRRPRGDLAPVGLYWALRDYQTPGQLGSEPTPQEFLGNLWQATAEMKRVLKPTGSIFIDLGDKYSGAQQQTSGRQSLEASSAFWQRTNPTRTGIPEKSLMLLPERYRIGCVDQLGLIARAVIVWDKPNGLPESVRDRVRRSHEDWVHLTKGPRYYSAIDEIRQPTTAYDGKAWADRRDGNVNHGGHGRGLSMGQNDPDGFWKAHPLGKLPGSVWSIPSEPLRLPAWLGVDHYAAFPSEWPRRFVLGWSPPGICVECGNGRVPVVERTGRIVASDGRDQFGAYSERRPRGETSGPQRQSGNGGGTASMPRHEATILGYACGCTPHTDHPGTGGGGEHGVAGMDDRASQGRYPNVGPSSPAGGNGHLGNRPKSGPWREYHLDGWQPPPTRPALVLDPFGGTGTVGMVARALGRDAISLDLSGDYCRASRWRIFHSGNAGKALARTNLERQGSLL